MLWTKILYNIIGLLLTMAFFMHINTILNKLFERSDYEQRELRKNRK